jgi:phosphohistidine phosphatase
MEIYMIRHAIACERDPSRWPDDRDRPLTPDGEERFRKVAKKLAKLVPEVDVLLSSPLARAWRTARILGEDAGWPQPEEFEPLEPGVPPAQIVQALRKHADVGRLALVGHEPCLHDLAAYLIEGAKPRARIEFKKGGVALLESTGPLAAGCALLRWMLAPRVLIALDD